MFSESNICCFLIIQSKFKDEFDTKFNFLSECRKRRRRYSLVSATNITSPADRPTLILKIEINLLKNLAICISQLAITWPRSFYRFILGSMRRIEWFIQFGFRTKTKIFFPIPRVSILPFTTFPFPIQDSIIEEPAATDFCGGALLCWRRTVKNWNCRKFWLAPKDYLWNWILQYDNSKLYHTIKRCFYNSNSLVIKESALSYSFLGTTFHFDCHAHPASSQPAATATATTWTNCRQSAPH